MATTKTIQATVKNRTDTATNWTQKNPVLAEGEIIVVQTSAGETRLKIGDGVKTFTQLPYTDEQIYNNVVTSVNGQTGDITTNSVEYIAQTLTDEQKKQARENIGVENEVFQVRMTYMYGNKYFASKNAKEIFDAFTAGKSVYLGNYLLFDAQTNIIENETKYSFKAAGMLCSNMANDANTVEIYGYRADNLGANDTTGYAIMGSSDLPLGTTYMSAAPTTDMQIATKKYVDDSVAGTADAVLYTAQTLTDEQKKQARENLGAEENHNGLLKKELYYQLQTSFNKNSFITYIKEGDITQFSDSEPNQSDIRKAFVFLALVMGKAGGQGYNNSDFQAHTKQLYAAYQAGLLQLPLTCYANPYYGARQLIHVTYTSDYFDVKAIYENGSGFDYGYKPSTDTFVDGTYTGSSMNTKSYQALTTPPSIGQFSMAAAPASDMEIATKKYVDDKISDKELILSSSTEGSTKKFKLTIDDTGTLTASEITA